MANSLPTFDAAPEFRTYTHLTCGLQTTVDGVHLRGLCDPVGGLLPTTTFCVHCARQDALERFTWADTDETLASYRKRIRDTLSWFYVAGRRLLLLACLLLVPAGLAYVGVKLIPSRAGLAGVAGFVIGLLAGVMAYGAYLGTTGADFRRYR